jgi:hypothetical protein
MKKIYDLAVKTGEYQKDGETKGKYVNVGSIMEKEDGGKFIFMNRTFNPAGVPNPENRDNILVSMFAPKKNEQTESAPPPDDEDIPF